MTTPVLSALFVVLVVLLIVTALRYSKRKLARLRDLLLGLTNGPVHVEVLGPGGRVEVWITVTGIVRTVEGDRLYLDSPSTDAPSLVVGLFGRRSFEDGIELERIKSVRGPGGVHWP